MRKLFIMAALLSFVLIGCATVHQRTPFFTEDQMKITVSMEEILGQNIDQRFVGHYVWYDDLYINGTYMWSERCHAYKFDGTVRYWSGSAGIDRQPIPPRNISNNEPYMFLLGDLLYVEDSVSRLRDSADYLRSNTLSFRLVGRYAFTSSGHLKISSQSREPDGRYALVTRTYRRSYQFE